MKFFRKKKKIPTETTEVAHASTQGHPITINPIAGSSASYDRNVSRAKRLEYSIEKAKANGIPEDHINSLQAELDRRLAGIKEFEIKKVLSEKGGNC